MISYIGDDGPRIDKAVACLGGVVVVYGSAGGIPACESVACRRICTLGDRLIELTVRYGGKRAVLIDNTRQRIRE